MFIDVSLVGQVSVLSTALSWVLKSSQTLVGYFRSQYFARKAAGAGS